MSDTKIVIVAGQRFSVASTYDNEAIRQYLLGQGFADVANAEIKTGKEGETPTVEFVKRAGTKGLLSLAPAILERLARVPSSPTGRPADERLVTRLLAGELTFEEAVADDAATDAINALAQSGNPHGARLCQRLDALPAVAAPARRGW